MVLLAAAGSAGGGAAAGQPGVEPATPAPAQGGAREITGRDFAGLRIAASVQVTDLMISGARAWMWTEDVPAGRVGQGPPATQRLLVRGDARVDIGLYHFTAAQASVWVQRVSDSASDPERGIYQVAIYFDRVSDPGGQAGTAQTADRLLVTGILDGVIRTRYDAMTSARPVDPFLRESEARLARVLKKVAGEPGGAPGGPGEPAPELEIQPGEPAREVPAGGEGTPAGPINPGVSRPFERDSPLVGPDLPTQPGEGPGGAEQAAPIFAERGIITFAFQTLRAVHAGEENAIIFPDGVVAHYSDTRTGRSLEMSAERAVVFTEPGRWGDAVRGADAERQTVEFAAGRIRGVFLEGNVVATDGQYTVRGPRVYYDMQNNRALILDAVFWTYDEERRLPLYVRAKSIRQLARRQWVAKSATIATTSFFDPQLSLGASSVTVTQRTSAGGRVRTLVDAKDVTLRAGGLPFFYVPRMRGDIGNIPLREVRVENSTGSGGALKTSWDLFTLLGMKHPEGVGAHLLVDGYFDRGAALGAALDWKNPTSNGSVLGYTIINDNGTDQLSSGAKVDVGGETRGIVMGDHRWTIDDHWSVFLEGAYASDERLIDSFFRWIGQSRREFTNAAYLRSINDNTEFSLLAKGEVNDFTPNQYLQESQGYTTDKVPEAYYARVNDDVLAGAAPGLISYTSEYRLSRMNLNFVEPTAAELGFNTSARAMEAFGLTPNESLGDRLRARGLTESDVLRADTRQELSMPLKAGPVTLTPFAVGRATAYDRDFSDFSADSTDQVRLWGAAGARAATTLQAINDDVDSRFFDLHRTRHIIEPSVTVWTSGTNLQQTDLPVYDDSVESIASGSAVRAGVTQTWQTQRGGAGRWHSVDVLKISTDVVFSTDDADRESPIGHFYDWRPEYSLLGDYGVMDVAWQLSDAMALSFNTVYDFETHQPARTGTGIIVQHSEDFSVSAELRYLNARDITLLDFTASERLTKKYLVSGQVTFDVDRGEIQWVGGTLRRRFAQTTIGLTVRYNNISGETGIGVVIEPAGLYSGREELRRRLGGESGGVGVSAE